MSAAITAKADHAVALDLYVAAAKAADGNGGLNLDALTAELVTARSSLSAEGARELLDGIRADVEKTAEGRGMSHAMAAMFYAAAGAKVAPSPAELYGEPMSFDFDAEPAPPVWRVDRLYEQGTVNLFSGDTGGAKSIMAADLAIAAVTGRTWLGRQVTPTNALYIDEENPGGLVRRRLAALKMTNEARGHLHYFSKKGMALDTPEFLAWLEVYVRGHAIGLVVVDTTTSATEADLSDNRAVANVFRGMRAKLGTLMEEHGLTLVLLHHERKRRADETYNSSQAAIGARAWANQADAHTTTTIDEPITLEDVDGLPEGYERYRSTFRWAGDVKGRGGELRTLERVAVTSEKDPRGRLLWMRVESEGSIEDAEDSRARELAVRIAHVVRAAEDKIRRKQIAQTIGEKDPTQPSGTFKRGLARAVQESWTVDLDNGYFTTGQEAPPQEF